MERNFIALPGNNAVWTERLRVPEDLSDEWRELACDHEFRGIFLPYFTWHRVAPNEASRMLYDVFLERQSR